MRRCIVAGCTEYAAHNIGIRLRRPNGTAIWAPNTAAFVCATHATAGFRIQIALTPNTTGEIETEVSSVGSGSTVCRTTPIVQSAI
jgi:hypothetical protein